MAKHEDEESFDLQELLKKLELTPDEAREQAKWEEVVRTNVSLKLTYVQRMHTTAVLAALVVLLFGIIGPFKWYVALPLALVTFLILFHLGKNVISAAFDRRLKNRVDDMMR